MRASSGDGMGHPFPEDFSTEEVAFALELRDLFPVEREELPPYYVSTLAGSEWHAPLESAYEQKVSYRVFRELRLPRVPLFDPLFDGAARWWAMRPTWSGVARSVAQTSRPLLGAMSAVMLLMVLTVVMASPSFAAGMRILLGQTGVDQVQAYPRNIQPAQTSRTTEPPSVPAASLTVGGHTTPLYWMGPSQDQYSYLGMWVLDQQEWSKGPIAEIQYALGNPSPDGSGIIDIREFQVATEKYASVLQVVQVGSASEVQVGPDQGVFVDGVWQSTAMGHAWQFGTRSELMLERDGTIFWIVGNQRDGIGQDQLIDIAIRLTLASGPLHAPMSLHRLGREVAGAMRDPVQGELYAVVPRGVSSDSGIASFVQMRGQAHSLAY
jgi:hypothetical protein